MTEHVLHFLALGSAVGGHDLARMKVSSSMASSPYIAFGSRELGDCFISSRRWQGEAYLLREDELTKEEADLLGEGRVLLFRSLGEVERYLAQPEEYSHSAELMGLPAARAAAVKH